MGKLACDEICNGAMVVHALLRLQVQVKLTSFPGQCPLPEIAASKALLIFVELQHLRSRIMASCLSSS
jgi:hypothetical protein